MRLIWIGMTSSALLVCACRGSNEQNAAPVMEQAPARSESAPRPTAQHAAPAAATTTATETAQAACRPTAEVEQTADRLIEVADTNGDGKVSKEEATSAANFLFGGFFFRADANGDGTVTPEEGRQARTELMSQHPAIEGLLHDVRTATGQNPFAAMAAMLDVDYGKPLTLVEARDAAKRAADGLFSMVDENHDGVVTAAEARQAADSGSSALGHAVFKSADTDNNGKLSFSEFQAALQVPAKAAFEMADTTKNGQLSEPEAANAARALMRRVWIYSPPGKDR